MQLEPAHRSVAVAYFLAYGMCCRATQVSPNLSSTLAGIRAGGNGCFIEVGEFQIGGIPKQSVQGEFFPELDPQRHVAQQD